MMRTQSENYQTLRAFLDKVPVIETHEHYTGIMKPVQSALDFILQDYYFSDLMSAAFGKEKQLSMISSQDKMSYEERVSLFLELYRKSNKTAYARGIQAGLREC
jgi:hypothetical protein